MRTKRLLLKKLVKWVLVGAWALAGLASGAGVCAASDLPAFRAVPEVLVHMDAEADDHPGMSFALIVDKSRQQARLYHFDGYWQMVAKWACSTGKLAGPKQREGDRRTPEGVYFVTRDVAGRYLSGTYGTRALTLDYPNLLDAHLSHSGSAIWLHGTNKPLRDRDSNGCIVFENAAISRLANYMRLNRTPVIIVDRFRFQTVKDARRLTAKILAAAEMWHNAMMSGNFDEFRAWYAPDAGPSMQWWQKWCRQRRKAGLGESYQSVMAQRSIYKCGDYYVLLFDHYLHTASRSQWVGRRKLFLRVVDDQVRILGDAYQTAACRHKDPLFYSWKALWDTGPDARDLASKPKNGQDS
jgi:murein L,D-transpeptidase YafK